MSITPFSYPDTPVYFLCDTLTYCPTCEHPMGSELRVRSGNIGAWATYKNEGTKVLLYFGDFDEFWAPLNEVFSTREEAEAALKAHKAQHG